jgi:hypothetical protein
MDNQPPKDEALNWRRDEPIAVPLAMKEKRLAIRQQDWHRLKNKIARIDNKPTPLSIWYSILFGVSVSAGLSIIPIYVTKDLPAWVFPLYICIFVFSFLCAIALVLVDKKVATRVAIDCQDIVVEMKDIEAVFESAIETEVITATHQAAP